MQRSLMFTILTAVAIPAASLWAAPPAPSTSSQFANQIAYEAGRVQAAADGLEGYVRSGANGRSALVYAQDMATSAKKLASLADKVTAQPGLAGEARAQAEKMKVQVAGLRAMVAGTASELTPAGVGANNADTILADAANIENRSNTLRNAAQSFSGVN
jgi:hypothetical protein